MKIFTKIKCFLYGHKFLIDWFNSRHFITICKRCGNKEFGDTFNKKGDIK